VNQVLRNENPIGLLPVATARWINRHKLLFSFFAVELLSVTKLKENKK